MTTDTLNNEECPHHHRAICMAHDLEPLKTAIVHPTDSVSLRGAVEAAEEGIIEAILVGPEDKICKTAEEEDIDISPYTIVPTHRSSSVFLTVARMFLNILWTILRILKPRWKKSTAF